MEYEVWMYVESNQFSPVKGVCSIIFILKCIRQRFCDGLLNSPFVPNCKILFL